MVSEELKTRLKEAADRYERSDFVKNDPVQFPRRFSCKRDIEISGLLTALISFGNRKQIIAKAEKLHGMLRGKPYEFVISRSYEPCFPAGGTESFYRTISYGMFRNVLDRLHNAYSLFPDLESCLLTLEGTPMERMCAFLEVSPKSPQKKINMFLRWMIRRDSPVDFGLWGNFSPAELVIPLDTHVARMAYEAGITDTGNYSLASAKKITSALSEVFPGDPTRGDFALFGAGAGESRQASGNRRRHGRKTLQP